jgi:RNA polymerase sigma-70 factor (ECF subfamily)
MPVVVDAFTGTPVVTLDPHAEAEVIGRVLAGDVDAYDLLVRAYMRKAYAVAYRVLVSSQDSEDAVQDAFFTALERLDTFDRSRPFGPWFLRIVANQARNLRRSNAVRDSAPLDEGTAFDGGRTPDRAAADAELREAFADALSQLAPRPRQIVQMADVDGLASTEIAELLDLSPGTVRAYLHEARQALRRILVAFRGDGT